MNAPTTALLKETAALKQKKFREARGLLLVEGRHPIEEAWKAGLTLVDWFALKDAPPASLPNAPLPGPAYSVDAAGMARIATTDSPPACVAVFETPPARSGFAGSLALVLDGVQDPGNLGTLIRSALAFGVDAVLLAADGVEPFSPKVIRASAGLVFALPVLAVSRAQLADLLPENAWQLFSTTGDDGAKSYRQADFRSPCAIILGNEGRGVSADLLAGRAVTALTIPMRPAVESLNVAVSGAIILAEAAAQRAGGPGAS